MLFPILSPSYETVIGAWFYLGYHTSAAVIASSILLPCLFNFYKVSQLHVEICLQCIEAWWDIEVCFTVRRHSEYITCFIVTFELISWGFLKDQALGKFIICHYYSTFLVWPSGEKFFVQRSSVQKCFAVCENQLPSWMLMKPELLPFSTPKNLFVDKMSVRERHMFTSLNYVRNVSKWKNLCVTSNLNLINLGQFSQSFK